MKRVTKDADGGQVYEGSGQFAGKTLGDIAKLSDSINADSLSAVSSSIGRARKCLYAVINVVDELAGSHPEDGGKDRLDPGGRIPALASEAADLDELVSQVHRELDRLRSLM